jgi:hypothetical protein
VCAASSGGRLARRYPSSCFITNRSDISFPYLVCKFVQKQNRRAEYDAGGFAMVVRMGDNFRYTHAIVFARRHNETRLLS